MSIIELKRVTGQVVKCDGRFIDVKFDELETVVTFDLSFFTNRELATLGTKLAYVIRQRKDGSIYNAFIKV